MQPLKYIKMKFHNLK